MKTYKDEGECRDNAIDCAQMKNWPAEQSKKNWPAKQSMKNWPAEQSMKN